MFGRSELQPGKLQLSRNPCEEHEGSSAPYWGAVQARCLHGHALSCCALPLQHYQQTVGMLGGGKKSVRVQKSPSAAFTHTPGCWCAGCSCPGSSGTVRLPELQDTCPASAGEDGERRGDLFSLCSYAKIRTRAQIRQRGFV